MFKEKMIYLISVVCVLVAIILFIFISNNAFRSTLKYFPATNNDYKKIKVKKIEKSSHSFQFNRLITKEIENIEFNFKSDKIKLLDFLKDTDTESFLVIKNDAILYEYYKDDYSRSSPMMIWSVTKVFISSITGIAIEEGFLNSINEKVINYIPELKGKISEHICIKHLLNMNSGINFSTEKYNVTPYLEVHYGQYLMKYIVEAESDIQPGVEFRYSQIDVILLALILRRTLNRPLSGYIKEKIWEPLGMEYDGYLAVDDSKFELERAASGLFATTEDIAKLGRLYLNNGVFRGKQIVPKDWVKYSNQNNIISKPKYMSYFWRHSVDKNNKVIDSYAVGANGNKLMYLVPSKDLIIVRFGKGMTKKHIKESVENLSSYL